MTCKNCKHNVNNECRRFPPIARVWSEHVGPYNEEREVTSYWTFPEVSDTHPACGEFKRRWFK